MICCFLGHRTIRDTPELREELNQILSDLIEQGATDFLFGDHSAFNDLCYQTVTALKEKYPAIRRIHFRKDYEEPDGETLRLLRTGYEDSICPSGVAKAGRASYVERNQAMIRESDVCIFYYDENYLPPRRKNSHRALTDSQPKSGTALSFAYAVQKEKRIFNLFRA